ncbi:MAG: adenylate/guanylate cyclase domain-containing protein [Hyphomicrobiales bacterium]
MNATVRLLPTLLVSIALLVLLSAGSIFVLNLVTNQAIVSELVSRNVRQSLDGLDLVLRDHLDPARFQADFIADAIHSGDLEFSQPDKLAEFTLGSMAAAPQIIGLIVAGPDGNAVAVRREPSGALYREALSIKGDAQLERMASEVRLQRDPYWGAPLHREDSNVTLMNLRVPIWRKDDYLGFVAVGISVQELSELASNLSDPPRSTVFVLYGPDKVLAHMFLALGPEGLTADKPLLGTEEVIDIVLNHLNDAKPFQMHGFEPPEGTDVLELEAGGTRYFVIRKTVSDYGDTPLLIGAYSVAAAVDAPLRAMYRTIVIGAGLVAFAIFLAVLISRMISRPVRETSDSAAAIASLDFDSVAPLRQSRIKEIDDLATSFNAMLGGLKSFGRYVPRALVQRLIRENRVGAGTEERDLTVMFTDIAGFTSTCEAMSPAEVADFINHHLNLVSECIAREGGTVDKYIGDAVMAFWGAPDSMDDAPVRAARAATAIQNALAADNEERAHAGLPRVRIRIGIHSGPLIVGDIGAPNRINYTVVGDVVNTAQRLESLGKEIDPEAEAIVLVSQTTRDLLDGTFTPTQVGRFRMKGKEQETEVYRLVT